MTKMKLGYWGIRGLAQLPRLLAAYTGIELEQTRYTDRNKWYVQEKENLGLNFPNLPYLIDGDFKLTESAAINRYIILQSGHSQLLGKTVKDRARVQNIIGVLKDAMKEIISLFFNKQYQTAKGTALEKGKAKLDLLQNFVGDKKWALGYLTLADFQIAEASYYFEAVFPDEYLNYSFWETIRQNFNALPEIVAYYKRPDALLQPFLPPQFAVMNPKFKNVIVIGYWGFRGLGQTIRILLEYSGLAWENKSYTNRQEWFEQDKQNLGFSFPNLPYLIDGQFKLTESAAIQRYIVNKSHHRELLGKSVKDTVCIESVIGLTDDINAQVGKNFWKKDEQIIKQTFEKVKPKLNYLAKFVGERSTVMEYLTLADFILAERSHYYEALFPEQYKASWGFLDRIRDTINNLESTKAYYNKQTAVKGPFMPPTAVLNPVWEQYK